MVHLIELWSFAVILLSAFVIGWGAEAAQTFIPRAVALSLLAWMQTLPEFAVEATIAWNQERDLMIANLTGSLRLIVGLGWPMIFFTQFAVHRLRERRFLREVELADEDFLGIIFLFFSILYFLLILFKARLDPYDSVVLFALYGGYLWLGARIAPAESEGEEDLPWVSRKLVALPGRTRLFAVLFFFLAGGAGLYFSVHPFLHTLQTWSAAWGISTFAFVQWIAPFLSEFPEYLTAFNWARQRGKAPLAMMNMVSSNINQWTMLAGMIPIVYSASLHGFGAVQLDPMHRHELALTIAQSALGGLLLLDLRFSLLDATVMLVLWLTQFLIPHLREPVTWAYAAWAVVAGGWMIFAYVTRGELPRIVGVVRRYRRRS